MDRSLAEKLAQAERSPTKTLWETGQDAVINLVHIVEAMANPQAAPMGVMEQIFEDDVEILTRNPFQAFRAMLLMLEAISTTVSDKPIDEILLPPTMFPEVDEVVLNVVSRSLEGNFNPDQQHVLLLRDLLDLVEDPEQVEPTIKGLALLLTLQLSLGNASNVPRATRSPGTPFETGMHPPTSAPRESAPTQPTRPLSDRELREHGLSSRSYEKIRAERQERRFQPDPPRESAGWVERLFRHI